ncbi:MAG: hypothetical protein WCO19_01890 [Candidatus Saccharibacteria bacterium]
MLFTSLPGGPLDNDPHAQHLDGSSLEASLARAHDALQAMSTVSTFDMGAAFLQDLAAGGSSVQGALASFHQQVARYLNDTFPGLADRIRAGDAEAQAQLNRDLETFNIDSSSLGVHDLSENVGQSIEDVAADVRAGADKALKAVSPLALAIIAASVVAVVFMLKK